MRILYAELVLPQFHILIHVTLSGRVSQDNQSLNQQDPGIYHIALTIYFNCKDEGVIPLPTTVRLDGLGVRGHEFLQLSFEVDCRY